MNQIKPINNIGGYFSSNRFKRILLYFLIIFIIIIADQYTKILITLHFLPGDYKPLMPNLNIFYLRNTGISFSLFQSNSEVTAIFLKIFTILISVLILYLMLSEQKLLAGISYALIFGGACGNIIDRFRLGFVVDFIDFYVGNWHFATFNIADAAITCGAILLITDYVFVKISLKSMKK